MAVVFSGGYMQKLLLSFRRHAEAGSSLETRGASRTEVREGITTIWRARLRLCSAVTSDTNVIRLKVKKRNRIHVLLLAMSNHSDRSINPSLALEAEQG